MPQPRHSEPLPLGNEDLPYSKGLMARALIATGVPADQAYTLARRIEVDLAEAGEPAATLERLDVLAREVLGETQGERAVDRLRRLSDLQQLDVPVIVMIGGSTGTGKSTVAVEVAHRLGINRVASTDFIRQTMRAFFSPEFMPTIHYSSFEAGKALDEEVTGDPAVVGFVEQCRHVCVGVDAAVHRSLTEGWSMVLEGVHLVPGLVPRTLEGALLVHVVLEIADEDVHRLHFHVRDGATGGSRAMDEVPGADRRHPPDPDLRFGARQARGCPGGRECERGPRDRRRDGARDGCGRAFSGVAVTQVEESAGESAPAEEDRPPCQCETFARVTERAALAGARWLGRADKEAAEEASFTAARQALERDADQRQDRDRRARGRGAARGRDVHRRGRRGVRPRARPARGTGGGRARRDERDLDDRRVAARLDAFAARHVHAEDGGGAAGAREDRADAPGRRQHPRDRRGVRADGRTTSRRSSSTGRGTTT